MIVKRKQTLTDNLLFILGLGLVLFLAVPVFAVGKDTAPGQTNNKSEKANQGKSTGNKVTIGSVEEVTGGDVIIGEKNNNSKTKVALDNDTKIVGQGKKESKLGAIKLKDMIAFVSSDSADATGGAKLKVKKVFVKAASESAQLKRRAVQGVIVELNGDVITLAHQIQRERTYTVIKNAATVITGKVSVGSPVESSGSANLPLLSVGQRIVAVGDLGDNGEILAKRIHIIPGKATGIFNRLPVSTPSASLSATPSASATISASTSPSASIVPSATP